MRSARVNARPTTEDGHKSDGDGSSCSDGTPANSAPDAGSARRFSTGEMARLSNNTLRTVRFYEEAGILQQVGRTDGGHRLFAQSDLDRLLLVTELREAGLSLDEIRDLLAIQGRAATGKAAGDAIQRALIEVVDSLERKREVLTRLITDVRATVEATAACRTCTQEEPFRDHCNDCDRVGPHEELPRGMRVLWNIEPKEH